MKTDAELEAIFPEDSVLCLTHRPGHLEGEPIEGSELAPCGACGEDVWVSRSTRDAMARNPSIHLVCCCCTGKHTLEDIFGDGGLQIQLHGHDFDPATGMCDCGVRRSDFDHELFNAMLRKLIERGATSGPSE